VAPVTGRIRGLPDRERQLANDLLDKGWSYRALRNGHLRFDHPGGTHSVTFPASPSDWRGWKNLRSQIRRVERAVADGKPQPRGGAQ
jgi:predicted RNA binding protein YcfA (HicA-like mRNA interferase family)